MTTDTKKINFSNKERMHGVASQAGHFLRHLLEMILAMFVGMAVGGAHGSLDALSWYGVEPYL